MTTVAPGEDQEPEPEFQPCARRRARPITFVLGALVIVTAGFFAGVVVQKHQDHGTTSASTTAARAGRFAVGAETGTGGTGTGGTGGGRFGGAGGGAGGGGNVVGQVKLIDGTNVYVTDTNGNVVKVTTGPSATISKTEAATVKDLAPGDTVVVRGTASADGSIITATSLTDAGAAGAGGGFGGFGGLGGSSGAGAAAAG